MRQRKLTKGGESTPTPVGQLYRVAEPATADRVVLDLARAIHASKRTGSEVTSWAAQQEASAFIEQHGVEAAMNRVVELGGPGAIEPPALRVWLIGEANPYQSFPRPEFDLYPEPAGSAGARLAAILGYRDDHAGYFAAFERRNLLYGTDEWSVAAARKAASNLLRDAVVAGGEHVFVLLGAKVATAFGYPSVPLFEAGVPGCSIRVLVTPHPSGLSRAWHDPTMAPRVRAAVEALRGGR